jgi:hypothetical protein
VVPNFLEYNWPRLVRGAFSVKRAGRIRLNFSLTSLALPSSYGAVSAPCIDGIPGLGPARQRRGFLVSARRGRFKPLGVLSLLCQTLKKRQDLSGHEVPRNFGEKVPLTSIAH